MPKTSRPAAPAPENSKTRIAPSGADGVKGSLRGSGRIGRRGWWLAAASFAVALAPLVVSAETIRLPPEGISPPSAPRAAPAPAPAPDRFEELRRRILGRIGSPGVAADLYELMDLVAESGSLERTADLLGRVARSGQAHQEVRALALRQLSTVERWRGRLPRMESNLAALGTIASLTVVGPFDDENRGGYDVAYGPEKELDLSRTYEGLRSQVSWRRLEGIGRTGTLVLREAVEPSSGGLIYALTVLDAPGDVSAVLYLGTPGAAKGWLGGRAILADPSYHPARFDQRAIPIRLRKGENPLLLKVAAGDSGPFELELRVVGEDGRPIRGLRSSAPAQGRWAAPEPIPPGRRILGKRPLVEPLEAAARAPNPSPRVLEDYARLLGERRPFDDSAKFHVAAAERAAMAAPSRVEAQLLAARYHVDDMNARRTFLERGVRAEAPGSALAHAALAAHWLAQGDSFRALELLEARRLQAPGDWRAELVRVRALDRRGEEGRAIRLLDRLIERNPAEPALLRERAIFHRRDGQIDDAMRLFRVVLGYRPADLSAALSLVSALVDRGAIDEAVERLALSGRLQPLDLGLLLRRAELLAANDRLPAARLLFREAAQIAPQNAEVFAKQGRAELRGGQTELATKALERALELRPQDSSLRELLESLQPGASRFAVPFLRELREVAQAADGRYQGEDAAKLVDLEVVRVMPSGQAARTIQTIVRVLNTRGVERYRRFQIHHAPGRDLLRIERARVLRPDGSIIDAHTESDHSVNEPWAGLYYDARVTVVGFPSLAPGDTVELVYRLDDVARDNLLSDYFGDVNFLADLIPTADWEYVLEMPAGRPIYVNDTQAIRTEEAREGGRRLYRWKASNLAKVVPEPQMPGWSEVAPYLHVSTYRDWESVGRFWWGLVKEQVEPTPEVARVAREVVAGIPASDVERRVQAIYDFVATKTRYVGLEFGIHSFKPYRVEQVLRRGFGDCKDKASLTYALLRSLGIESKLVLLRMRHLGSIGSYPASLAIFNHAILYVPSLDLYLDGTAEWSGSRELPEADRGAEILIVEPEGGSEFRVTPEAPPELSTTLTSYRVEVDLDGSAALVGTSQVSGLAAAGYRQSYAAASGRASSFERSWARSFPGVKVAGFDISDPRKLEEDVQLSYELVVPGYADVTLDGGLSFSPTRSASELAENFAALSSRRFDLVLRYPWTTSFRYQVELPSGYALTSLPASEVQESPFGSAKVHFTVEGSTLWIEGEVVVSRARVTPEDYPAFRSFLRQVDALLARKVVAGPASG